MAPLPPWVGPGVVAPLWGIGSAQLVVQGWRAYAEAFIVVVAVARGRMAASRILGALLAALLTGLFCSATLRAGFWWLIEVLGFGRTPLEQVFYCTALGLALRFMLPKLAARVKAFWRRSMDGAAASPGEPVHPGSVS